jgi:hypothetical protein
MSPAVLFSVTFTVPVDGTFLPSGRFTFFGALPVVSALKSHVVGFGSAVARFGSAVRCVGIWRSVGGGAADDDAAVSVFSPPFALTIHTTTPATTSTATPTTPAPILLRRFCCSNRRSSCLSSLRFAASRRCWLVATPYPPRFPLMSHV